MLYSNLNAEDSMDVRTFLFNEKATPPKDVVDARTPQEKPSNGFRNELSKAVGTERRNERRDALGSSESAPLEDLKVPRQNRGNSDFDLLAALGFATIPVPMDAPTLDASPSASPIQNLGLPAEVLPQAIVPQQIPSLAPAAPQTGPVPMLPDDVLAARQPFLPQWKAPEAIIPDTAPPLPEIATAAIPAARATLPQSLQALTQQFEDATIEIIPEVPAQPLPLKGRLGDPMRDLLESRLLPQDAKAAPLQPAMTQTAPGQVPANVVTAPTPQVAPAQQAPLQQPVTPAPGASTQAAFTPSVPVQPTPQHAAAVQSMAPSHTTLNTTTRGLVDRKPQLPTEQLLTDKEALSQSPSPTVLSPTAPAATLAAQRSMNGGEQQMPFQNDGRSDHERDKSSLNDKPEIHSLRPEHAGVGALAESRSDASVTSTNVRAEGVDALAQTAMERAQSLTDRLEAQGGGTARIRVRDSVLGEVQIHVRIGTDRQATVQITAEQPEVRKALESRLEDLRHSLSSHRLTVADLRVVSDTQNTQMNSQTSNDGQQQSTANHSQSWNSQGGNDARGRDGQPNSPSVPGGAAQIRPRPAKVPRADLTTKPSVQRDANGSLKVQA